MKNVELIESLKKLTSDKLKFKQIINFLKYNNYNTDAILDVLGVSSHTLKKYMDESKNSTGKYKYTIPIYIKKILSYYFKFDTYIWSDDEKSKRVSCFTPINNENKKQVIPDSLRKLLIGEHNMYVYNSSENQIYSDSIKIYEDSTFEYKHLSPNSNEIAKYNGRIHFEANLISFVSNEFTITLDHNHISNSEKIIKGFVSTITNNKKNLVTKRILFSRNKITNKEFLEKELDTFENHLFPLNLGK